MAPEPEMYSSAIVFKVECYKSKSKFLHAIKKQNAFQCTSYRMLFLQEVRCVFPCDQALHDHKFLHICRYYSCQYTCTIHTHNVRCDHYKAHAKKCMQCGPFIIWSMVSPYNTDNRNPMAGEIRGIVGECNYWRTSFTVAFHAFSCHYTRLQRKPPLFWTKVSHERNHRERISLIPFQPQLKLTEHDDVIKWKYFPRYWPFVRGIHRSRWIPRTKASNAELWCFLWSVPE